MSERTGGVSPRPFLSLNLGTKVGDAAANIARNESRILAALGLDPPARADLVHGTRCARVDAPGLVSEVDAIVTAKPGLALALTVADCYPLALCTGPWRALVHCGWRGVAGGIVEEVLRLLLELGADLEVARAWIGPGIGACCYEVGPEVARAFRGKSVRRLGSDESSGTGGDRLHLDLAAEIIYRLGAAGLRREAVRTAGLCTACHTERFFSHRAEGPTGRMSAYLF